MKRHAYLILAYNNLYVLEKLIQLIDDERSDIYIHVDIKNRNFDFDYFRKIVEKSKLVYVDRVEVSWGQYSMIEAELNLFSCARRKRYSYYHLLSDSDLILKDQNYIYDFFEKNEGKEFIICSKKERLERMNIKERFRYFYFSWDKNKYFLKLQKILNINRGKKSFVYDFGGQWVSLTNEAVELILSKREWIKKNFRFTYCCDEVYKQSILINSKFREALYREPVKPDTISFNMRYTKWEHDSTHPYVFMNIDFQELMESSCIFARKFDEAIDKDIIDRIYKTVINENKLTK